MGKSHRVKGMECPYCGGKAVLMTANSVYHYQKIYHGKPEMLWVCEHYPHCNSYVGCHKGTDIPLGRLANETLRKLKKEAHRQFDPLWKSGLMSRKDAYKWLADMLNIDEDNCHIGKFDNEMCKKVIRICKRQDNPEIRSYRLKHFGYEQNIPPISRGYSNSRKMK